MASRRCSAVDRPVKAAADDDDIGPVAHRSIRDNRGQDGVAAAQSELGQHTALLLIMILSCGRLIVLVSFKA